MVKELLLSDPPIRCFLFDAVPLSILAIDNNYLPWFYSNYIQVCCRKDILERKELFLQFYGPDQAFFSPFIKLQYFSWEVISKCKVNIIDLIIENINNGYYFWGYIDDYYVPFRPSFEKNHLPHDIFIYGYDSNKLIFKVLGYDKNNTFVKCEITFEFFYKAFLNNTWNKEEYYWIDRIYFFQHNKNGTYNIDLFLIKELLEDYYYSRNTSKRYRRYNNPVNDSRFGMETYEGIKEYYDLIINSKIFIDKRVPFLLWEHKVCMVARLNYLMNYYKQNTFKKFINIYTEIEKKSNILLNLTLKYKITKDNKNIKNSILLLSEIEDIELCIIPEIIKNIKNIM